MKFDNLRIAASLICAVLVLAVIKLIAEGPTVGRIVAEVILIGVTVYLLTFVVRPLAAYRRSVEIETTAEPTEE